MKLKQNCTICGKTLDLLSENSLLGGKLRNYKCGHSFYERGTNGNGYHDLELVPATEEIDFTSLNGSKEAYTFQKEGYEFCRNANWNCIIADPMGLGKTIQGLLVARNAKKKDGSLLFKTILGIVKPNTIYQWYEESKEWFDGGLWSTFMIQGTKGFVPPGFRLYLLSMDTLSRKGVLETCKNLNPDLVIVDECHSFKNTDSNRSQALVAFLQGVSQTEIERDITLTCNLCHKSAELHGTELAKPDGFNGTWQEKAKIFLNIQNRQSGTVSYRHQSKCPRCQSRIVVYQDRMSLDDTERQARGLIMLSGTPIKNRADEYFVPLNLIRPDIFTSQASFRREWLLKSDNGKYERIKPWRLDDFRELTKNFIIRRDKNAVLSLPPFRRTFETIQIEDERIKVQYNQALKELRKTAEAHSNLNFFDVQENLMTLRRITGMGKVPFAVEYIQEFLESIDDEKIAIGIHHEAVRDNLYYALTEAGIPTLKYSGEDSPEQKNRTAKLFQNSDTHRVMVINMIAGGVGLNLQACNNSLTLERQWNAADEEQYEGRFWRNGQTRPVNSAYMLAKGTIDTYLTAMVEKKRQICGESLDGWNFTQDADAISELIEKTLASELK